VAKRYQAEEQMFRIAVEYDGPPPGLDAVCGDLTHQSGAELEWATDMKAAFEN